VKRLVPITATLLLSTLAINPVFASPDGVQLLSKSVDAALLSLDLGQYSRAATTLRSLLSDKPNDAFLLTLLGRALVGIENLKAAEKTFLRALQLDPGSIDAYLGLGYIYGRRGDLKKAISLFDSAIKADPESAKAYSDRGVTKGAMSQFKESIADFDRAIEIDPRYADAYRNRGIAYDALKQNQNACNDWHSAFSLGQDHPKEWFDAQCKGKKKPPK